MASSVQVLLSLICVVIGEAHVDFPLPFCGLPGLPHLTGYNPSVDRNNQPIDTNVKNHPESHNYQYQEAWENHDMEPKHLDQHENIFSYYRHHDNDPYHHIMDPYAPMPGERYPNPEKNNIFNIPYGGHNSHSRQPPQGENNPEEPTRRTNNDVIDAKPPQDKPKEVLPIDEKPALQVQDKERKLNEANETHIKNNAVDVPPKTNDIKKYDVPKNNGDKGNKNVSLNKNKDFLLVGSGGNGNDIYLLHEQNPNQNAVVVPNANQPSRNVIYVPYNLGQSNNQVYQVFNGQNALPTNVQVSPEKFNVNGYNNVASNTWPPTINVNLGNINPGYVLVYSNGQLIQIPSVEVNPVQNNVPVQNANPIQGTHYIIANTVPNTKQNVPAVQNPGTNIIYATRPNQGNNNPIVVQIPTCVTAVPNNCGSGAVVQNLVQDVSNADKIMTNSDLASNGAGNQPNQNMVFQLVTNGYAQPNMIPNQAQGGPSQGSVFSNQNGLLQPSVQMPTNTASIPVPNGYNQPMMSILGQIVNVRNQGAMLNNQNIPLQPAVQFPVDSGSNEYSQPMVPSQGQGLNVPNLGDNLNNQNMPFQQAVNGYNQPMVLNKRQDPNQRVMLNNQNAVEIPVNSGWNGYSQPISNQGQGTNVPSQGALLNNENMLLQKAVEMPPDIGSNRYAQPTGAINAHNQGAMLNNEYDQHVPNHGDQGTNDVVNIPYNEVVNRTAALSAASLPNNDAIVFDDNDLSSLGAQPAIMISGFKEEAGDKKDKKKSEDRKDKKDKTDQKK